MAKAATQVKSQATLDGSPIIKPLDVIMWVGRSYYTIDSFIKEAKRLGACKRFGGGLPRDIVVGKSRVFLVHDFSEEDKKKLQEWKKKAKEAKKNKQPIPPKPKFQPRVFAYFTIRGILVVGDARMIAEKEGVKLQKIDGATAAGFQKRGCGSLVVGATYFVSEEDMAKLQKYADSVEGHINVIEPPIPVSFGRFRGYKYVVGDRILNREPEEAWFEVDQIRKANAKVMRKLAPKPKVPKDKKPKRKTFKETILEILNGYDKMELNSLIMSAIFANPPFSTRPRAVYRNVITKLAREGKLSLEKEGKTWIVKVNRGAIDASTGGTQSA